MKIRKGFVSNSSTSSFICDVCGGVEAGMDLSIGDAGMAECENEHVFCQDHIINKEGFAKYSEKNGWDEYYEIPKEFCPICSMQEISKKDIVKYLLMRSKHDTMKEVKDEIIALYGSYESMRKNLDNKE